MHRTAPILLCLTAFCWLVTDAAAQTLNDYTVIAKTQERISENHWKLSGGVELEQKDTKLFADEVEWFTEENRAVAVGNVVFTQGNNRIASDRAEFDTKTRFGTFYGASGIANVQPPTQRSTGAFAPPMSTEQTDVYFFGDVVEKIGAKKYKITNGGFSTCVQPTPRWDLHADTVVLNIDHYTFLRNAVLNVKGVPMFYLPVLYYPTKEEGRATGILLPTYGASSLRGQAIHNAFFWAINRSQDATFMHDWYSKAGQGVGAEYRYNFGGGADGTLQAHVLDQNATTSVTGSLPKTRAYEVRGSANQMLPGRLQARLAADYYSSVSVMQSFNTNVYDASRNSRYYGANVVGAWRNFSLNGTYDRRELYFSQTSSGVFGNLPRITLARNEKPLFRNAPVYFSANTEFVRLARQNREGDAVVSGSDSSLSRFDVAPQIRYPFNRWQWFTVNSSLGWRETFYTRSYDAAGIISDNSLNRQYVTMQARATGPVLNRIFNTPESRYAERFKHTIEPFIDVQRTSSIDNYARIVVIDSFDAVVGNTTNFRYGVNNRIYAKRPTVSGRPSAAQEILAFEVVQTYYTSPLASRVDTQYLTSFTTAVPNNFSPVQVSLRATPTTVVNATVRAEIDSKHRELRTMSANSSLSFGSRVQSQVGWAKTFLVEGFNDRNSLQHMLNASANVRTQDNRFGGTYSFNYDILRKGMLQQRMSAYYNAQCCGIAFEQQTYNYAGLGSIFPPDRRFFLSVTLAGLGNFSPFNGGMGGIPR